MQITWTIQYSGVTEFEFDAVLTVNFDPFANLLEILEVRDVVDGEDLLKSKDPVARAIAHWAVDEYESGDETGPLREALTAKHFPYFEDDQAQRFRAA